jgi:hypothetical protein
MRVTALVMSLAAAMLVVQPAALSSTNHRNGAWLYPPEVAQTLSAHGYPAPACSGRGSYRWTSRSTPNSLQTWQYKHFECFFGAGPFTYLCVHSLQSRGIVISRVMVGNAYRPCRF